MRINLLMFLMLSGCAPVQQPACADPDAPPPFVPFDNAAHKPAGGE